MQITKKIKTRIYNAFYNSTFSNILNNTFWGLFIIWSEEIIFRTTSSLVRNIIFTLILFLINSSRLVFSIKSGKISFKKIKNDLDYTENNH